MHCRQCCIDRSIVFADRKGQTHEVPSRHDTMHLSHLQNNQSRRRFVLSSFTARLCILFGLQANTRVKSWTIAASKPRAISTSKVCVDHGVHFEHVRHALEPQWRFETKMPGTMEGDENDKIELECSVQDEDAECEWYFAGEVSSVQLRSACRLTVVLFARKFIPSPIRTSSRSSPTARFASWW